MTSILKVDTIQDADGNNIINESSNTITIGASGDTTNIVGTLQNNGAAVGGVMTPMFYANQQSGTAQSISANTFTKLNMGTEDFDTASNYDTSNSRFTPQTSGKYWVFGSVMFATGTDISQIECGIYKNGSLIALNISPNDSYNNSYVTTILSLNGSSDYIELYAKHNASGSQTTATYNDGRYVKFGAYKIIE